MKKEVIEHACTFSIEREKLMMQERLGKTSGVKSMTGLEEDGIQSLNEMIDLE